MDEQPVPRILPRQEHPLSRSFIDPDALKILYRLHHHGFRAYLVGGCVRDLLLGKTPKDFDVATDAHPQQIRELFRNSRLIGRRFRLAHIFFKNNKFIEVSTFRRRSEFEEEGEKDHPHSDNTFGTPSEDAFRRDITINGIFYNIADFSLIDYVGGLEDLRQKIIRCIGDPEEKFISDPVRMIRVIRHAARTGFTIEEKTYRSLIGHVAKLRLCSPARVREEFLRELREGSLEESMKMMLASGMLFSLFPSFSQPFAEAWQKEYFIKIITAIDDLSSSGKVPSEEFCLALFLLPCLGFYCPPDGFPPGRRGQALFQQKVREWVTETMRPLQFTRQAKEAAIYLLGSQRIFREFLPERKLPLRFMRQPYFSQALHLFEIEARARGEGPAGLSWPTGERTPPWKRRKKRHRRKKKKAFFSDQKPKENHLPNLPEIPNL
ncbi:MAG: polynucleotide adenylyltransferase PcnB [Deltaproteobacteria bacterium]|nr:polynucleotide adenylyltransferase PcnB [Deltaproteobacteria bacterium]